MSTQDRFAELWTDFLEGDLNDSSIGELRDLLAADPLLVRQAADLFQTHRLLGLNVEDEPPRHDEFVRETLAMLPESQDDFVRGVMSSVEHSQPNGQASGANRSTRRMVSIPPGTTALLILMAALLLAFWPREPNEPKQAITNGERETGDQLKPDVSVPIDKRSEVILTQAASAELFGELLPPVGDALEFDHEYALVAGLIALRFPDGAEVILESPSVIEITGRERLLVSAGHCSVHAPPGAEGFQIETPQTEITDLGTRFSVSVSEVGETDVQVVEGLAEVLTIRDAAAQPIRLADREARRFNGDVGLEPQSLEFNADRYRKRLPDRVVSYEAGTTEQGYAWDLQSVTVQRAGVVHTFPVDRLIGVKVTHFRAGQNTHNVIVPVGFDGDRLTGLESDTLLHTGIINPGGSVEPLGDDPVLSGTDDTRESTPGIALQFDKPVVNRPGPDVVFFELQTVTNPLEGDAFHVSPLHFEDGLRTQTIRRYDITMTSREARLLPDIDLLFLTEPVDSLQSLVSLPVERRRQTLRFRALAVGIDLSDLGYGDEATVDGLFIQDALDDNDIVDPVFVAGLPANLPQNSP